MERDVEDFLFLDDLFSSSSSDDESSSTSEDDLDEVILQNQRRKKPRVENFIETVIMRYNAVDFQENFRLSRTTFQYLLFIIRRRLEGAVWRFGNKPIDPEKQLYISLWFLGTPDSYRSVTSKFDVGKATAWRAVRRVVRAICELRNYFISWPTHEQARQTSMRIERKYNFPGVIGAIDGTHVKIAAPLNDSQGYINRKGVYSIQLQIVCNDKLQILHCYTGLPGSVHDARVFRHSGIQRRCNEEFFPDDTHLLGDSAYPLQRNVMVPFRDNGHRSIEETYFNTKLSSTRMMVERCNAFLKGKWRSLLDKLPMTRTDLISEYILCACILHNLCLKDEDTFEYPIIIPDTIDDDEEPMDVPDRLHEEGNDKRENLVRIINQNVQ